MAGIGHNNPPESLTDDQARDYAQELIGCCDGTNNASDAQHVVFEVMTQAQRETLDTIAFLCTCGWWCSADECNEIDGEWLCDDCAGEQKES